jgi:hypothetical protein
MVFSGICNAARGGSQDEESWRAVWREKGHFMLPIGRFARYRIG